MALTSVCARNCALLLPLLLSPASAVDPSTEAGALLQDGQCDDAMGDGSNCALSARQLRSRTFSDVDVQENCSSYGCGGFDSSRGCQCNEKCLKYNNCCQDYEAKCTLASGGSCQSYGCGGSFDAGRSCQCNQKCAQFDDCCDDFNAQCTGGAPAGSCASYGCGGFESSRSCQCNEKCHSYKNCCPDYKSQCAEDNTPSPEVGGKMPNGVNLGGWLVLEDWMFSGTAGRHVMTTGTVGQGLCLPPKLHSSGETWPSEGLLTKKLEQSHGKDGAVEIFMAHRKTYITDADIEQIASLGIREVRLPLPWTTFEDALKPLDASVYGAGSKIVPDPYYSHEASFVTVDRTWLVGLLRKASQHNLKIFLDMHTMPGGSSDATYSGVWPLPPKFWTGSSRVGDEEVPLTKVGLWIAQAFVQWVEGLGEPERSAVAGLTLLNEPAHMSYIDKGKGKPFVHSEKQVMDWMAESSDVFRKSSLPASGMKLHVSIIESAFQYFWDTAPAWWSKTFTQKERHSWAVFDIHFYDAWTPKCSGRSVKGGGYVCSQPISEIQSIIRECHNDYMSLYAKKVDGLKACTEFSVATFEDPVLACNDDSLLKMYLGEQVKIFEDFEIEAFFWSWRMPHGRNFEKAWSLKRLAGLEESPEALPTC